MKRLSLALIWLLAVIAGAAPAGASLVWSRSEAAMLGAEPLDAPALFRPAHVEHLLIAAPARPSPWRHSSAHADLRSAAGIARMVPVGRLELSRQPLAPLIPARPGVPRFPTGPPPA